MFDLLFLLDLLDLYGMHHKHHERHERHEHQKASMSVLVPMELELVLEGLFECALCVFAREYGRCEYSFLCLMMVISILVICDASDII